MPIHGLIFDFGNVLCHPPRLEDFRVLYRLSGLDEHHFQEYFWRHRADYDRGALDGPAYWRRIESDAGMAFSPGQVEDLIASDIALWQRLNDPLIRWVLALRQAGIKTAVLSNMPRDLAEQLRQDSIWSEQFDHLTLSGELGLLKPEGAIYEHCLNGLLVKPQEALFIDDKAENVEGARAVGIQALKFESVQELSTEIEPFRLPVALADVINA